VIHLRPLIALVLLIILSTMVYSYGHKKFTYGVKFGIVKNSFDYLPDGANNPFQALDFDSKTGFIGGVFYDWAPLKYTNKVNITFGLSYKMLVFKGDFVSLDNPPIIGDFKDYFHCLDVPIGIKLVNTNMNGRPFIGAGIQTDFIIAESQTTGIQHSDTMETEPHYDTIPTYNSKANIGTYFCTGFEIPGQSYLYVIQFKYIRWGKDNFTSADSFFNRNKNELQITFGIKLR